MCVCALSKFSYAGTGAKQCVDLPFFRRGIMKETEEMELGAFKLTMNFRKTARCERKGHCYWKTKSADWYRVCSDAMPSLQRCVCVCSSRLCIAGITASVSDRGARDRKAQNTGCWPCHTLCQLMIWYFRKRAGLVFTFVTRVRWDDRY